MSGGSADILVWKVQCSLHYPPGTFFVFGISISFQLIVLQVVFVLLFKNMFTNIKDHVSFHSRNCANVSCAVTTGHQDSAFAWKGRSRFRPSGSPTLSMLVVSLIW